MAVVDNSNTLQHISGLIVLAGAGKMGGAMLTGWLARGLDPKRVVVVEPAPSAEITALAAKGIRINPNDASPADTLVIALHDALTPAEKALAITPAGAAQVQVRVRPQPEADQRRDNDRTVNAQHANGESELAHGLDSHLHDNPPSANVTRSRGENKDGTICRGGPIKDTAPRRKVPAEQGDRRAARDRDSAGSACSRAIPRCSAAPPPSPSGPRSPSRPECPHEAELSRASFRP